jgi:hypothetical protein
LAAPAEYSQMYVIYKFYYGKCIPIIHCLLHSKKEEEYLEVFSELKKLYNGLNPKYIVIDQEKAPFNAFNKKLFLNQKFIFV